MHARKRARLPQFDYSAPGGYFITVCCRGGACLFGRVARDHVILSAAGTAVVACWRDIPSHFPGVALDAFVVMPDHIHGIVFLERAGHARPLHPDKTPTRMDVGAGHARPVPTIVGSFKTAVSKRLDRSIWQRGYHDRVIRNEAEPTALRRYIAENPLRWALGRESVLHPPPA